MSKRRAPERQPRPAARFAAPAASAPGQPAPAPAVPAPVNAGGSSAIFVGALAAGLAALVLYIVTLAPTVATGDSGELTTVATNLGLAHPPGYPTFTLLGHVFSWLPIGNPAWRINLMSAVLDAAAVVLLGVAIARTLAVIPDPGQLVASARRRSATIVRPSPAGRGPLAIGLAAAVGALLLAISTAFWRYSLVAEVFGLSNILAVALLALMLEWSRRPERSRLLWAAGLVAGLSLTNQQTVLFVAPALLILLIAGIQLYTAPAVGKRAGPPVPWGLIWTAVGFAVIGLLPYLYLPIAAALGAPSPWGDAATPIGFLGIVLRFAYGTFSLTVRDTAGSPLEHLGLFGGYLWSAFTPVGLALAAVGGVWLAMRRLVEAAALVAWFLVAGPLFLFLANPPLTDPVTRGVLERFYILPTIPLALAAGIGVWAAGTWLRDQLARIAGGGAAVLARGIPVVVLAAALAGTGVLAATRIPAVDESQNHVAEHFGADLLGQLPQGAVLLMRSDEYYTSVTYAQDVAGLRPDVTAIDVELLKIANYVRLVERRDSTLKIPFASYDGGQKTSLMSIIEPLLGVRPVYIAGDLEEDLSTKVDMVDEGLVEEVLADGEQPDNLVDLRADPHRIDRLHPPDHQYPPTTWEAAIAAHYADVPFKSAVALQELGPQADWTDVEALYRQAISISPTLSSAYKNLGVLIKTNAGPSADVIDAWTRYLELNPDDPEAGAIRAEITKLGGTPPPTPAPTP